MTDHRGLSGKAVVIIVVMYGLAILTILTLAVILGKVLSGPIPPETTYGGIQSYVNEGNGPYHWGTICIMPKGCKTPEAVVLNSTHDGPDNFFEVKIETRSQDKNRVRVRPVCGIDTSLIYSKLIQIVCSNRKEYPSYVFINVVFNQTVN